jgi:hypothetical protein
MLMPIIPDGFGEALWVFDAAGDPDPYLVTLGFAFEVPFVVADFLSALEDTWATNLKPTTSNSLTLRETRAEWNDGGTMFTAEKSSGQTGELTDGVLPQNCALLVRKNTGLSGRKFRGRNYWPLVLSEANVNNAGVIDPGNVSDLQDIFDAMYTDINDVTNVSTALLHSDATDPTFITGFSVQNTIATQRRRLR